MNALQAMIAQGGNYESPVKRFMQVRQFQQAEAGNALARQASSQGISMNALNMQHSIANQNRAKSQEERAVSAEERAVTTAEQQQQAHTQQMLAGLGGWLRQIPKEQRVEALSSVDMGQFGLDPLDKSVPPENAVQMAEMAYLQANGPDKGSQVNAMMADGTGGMFSVIEGPGGRLLDSVTLEHIPGAIKAPTGAFDTDDLTGRTNAFLKKQQEDAIAAESGLRALNSGIGNVIGLIEQSPDMVGGWTGDALVALNSATEQFKSLTGADKYVVDGEINKDKLGNVSKENQRWLRRAAQSTDRADSATLELAFLHALVRLDTLPVDEDAHEAPELCGVHPEDRLGQPHRIRVERPECVRRPRASHEPMPRHSDGAQPHLWRECPAPRWVRDFRR